MPQKKQLSEKETIELLDILQQRFEKNKSRHENLEWTKIEAKLNSNPSKLWSLYQMENSGGEPDVVDYDQKTSEYIFFDCSAESPKGRRSF